MKTVCKIFVFVAALLQCAAYEYLPVFAKHSCMNSESSRVCFVGGVGYLLQKSTGPGGGGVKDTARRQDTAPLTTRLLSLRFAQFYMEHSKQKRIEGRQTA